MRGARTFVLGAALVLLLGRAVPSRGQDAPPDDAGATFRGARAEIVPRLAAFATWCGSKGLPRSRDRAWEAVLRFQPENAAARRALHHQRAKDGSWEIPGSPKPTTEPDPSTVPEYLAQHRLAYGAYCDLAFGIVEGKRGAPVGVGDAVLLETAVDDLLALLPDDERARRAARETLAPGGWRLDETLRARVRRREIADAVASARAALPARGPAAPEASVAAWGVAWAQSVQGAKTRVFGAPGTTEADAACAACDLGQAVYERILGIVPLEVPDLTIFLFPRGEDAWAAMDRDARFSAADRKSARGLSGWWTADRPHVLGWAPDGPTRIDAALRQAVGIRLRWQSGVDTRRGWAWEGFGLYLSEAVLASHRTVFAGETRYDTGREAAPGLAGRLRADTADWLSEGRALEAGAAWPDFRVLLGRPVEAMTPQEVLAGYLLARYLVEGRPEDVPTVVAAVGKAAGPDEWCASALRGTVGGLERRLRRWIRESAGP